MTGIDTAKLRGLLKRAKINGLSIPGDPAWPIEQEQKASVVRTLQDYQSYLPALLDELERLRRIERNRDMWKGQCERQAQELERLRGALEPFADGPPISIHAKDHDRACDWQQGLNGTPTIGQIRAARLALDGEKGG